MHEANQLHNLITSLLSALFEREDKFLAERQLAMIGRNAAKGGSTDGFRHMGAAYTELTGVARTRATLTRLHSELADEMNDLLEERKTISFDKDRVRQALFLVLRDCVSWQDIRDALPNSLKALIPECANLERTRKEAFTIDGNARAHSQYMHLRDKIEFYTASQLLY